VVAELTYIANELVPDVDVEIEAPNQWVMSHDFTRKFLPITVSVRRFCLFHIEGILTAGNAWDLHEIMLHARGKR
jgi:hypothetical protein